MSAYFERLNAVVDNLQVIFYDPKLIDMSFRVLPVFLAFFLNRCSVRFFTTCRCVLGFTPFSASLLFGLALVAILVKHPELYPSWLRKLSLKIMFLYELLTSMIFIEVGFCLWNSIENFFFSVLPSFLEIHSTAFGDYYIHVVESPVGVSLISNFLAFSILLTTLHITRFCNFNLLFRSNGIHRFFADAGLTSKLCKHHRRLSTASLFSPSKCTTHPRLTVRSPKTKCMHSPKILRSGKNY